MAIVAVGMVYSGVAAGGFAMTWAGLAAGAQIVGGVVSLVGTLTGDKKMENAGMMLGAAGSLGRALVGSAGSTTAAAGNLTEAEIKRAAGQATMQEAGAAAGQAATGSTEFLAINDKLSAMEKAQKMNLVGNVAQGVSTAYTGYQQNKQMKDQFNQSRQDEKALLDERRRNMDLTQVKMNIPVAPRMKGLINIPQIDRSRVAAPIIKG